MIGIISSLALLAMFAVMIMEERSRVRMCHALYLERFDNRPVPKDERIKMVAHELSLHTNVRYVATHGCIVCQSLGKLYTLSEALLHLQRVRATAF